MTKKVTVYEIDSNGIYIGPVEFEMADSSSITDFKWGSNYVLTAPPVITDNDVLVFASNTWHVYPIAFCNKPDWLINPTWNGEAWVEGASLDELKQRKAAEIAAARWEDEVKPFLFKGYRFDASPASQIKYMKKAQALTPERWKTQDGWVDMTQQDFIDLIASYESYLRSIFAKEEQLQLQVANASTYEELSEIKW